MENTKVALALIFSSALLDSLSAYIVKSQFNKLGRINIDSFSNVLTYLITFFKNPVLLLALLAFFLAPCLWFFALNKLELSTAYPILVGFHLVFVMIIGLVLLGEQVTPSKIFASILIGLSVWILYK